METYYQKNREEILEKRRAYRKQLSINLFKK